MITTLAELNQLNLSADVDPELTETTAGYNCLCYENDEYVTRFYFVNRADAEECKERWLAGDGSLRHRALLGRGFGLI